MTFQIDADLLGNPRRALAPREDGHRSPGSQGRLATAAGPPHSAAFTVPARASTLLSAQAGLIRTGVAAVARGPIILICGLGCVGSSADEHAAGCSCAALSIVSLHLFRSGASKNTMHGAGAKRCKLTMLTPRRTCAECHALGAAESYGGRYFPCGHLRHVSDSKKQ